MVARIHNTKKIHLGILINTHKAMVAIKLRGRVTIETIRLKKNEKLDEQISKWVHPITKKKNIKILGAGIIGDDVGISVGSKLWLEHDIVPVHLTQRFGFEKADVLRARNLVKKMFDDDGIFIVKTTRSHEVVVNDLVSLKAYKKVTPPNLYKQLHELANEFKTLKGNLLFINATSQGGGVALMRHALIRLCRLLGCEVRWYTLLSTNGEFFAITKKKFHNVLQSIAAPNFILDDNDISVYCNEMKKNAKGLSHVIKKANVIVIDDPQASGLIPHIRKINPQVKIIYRSHIQLEADLIATRNTPQYITWKFLWSSIKESNVFVSHPVEEFVPKNVPKKKVVFMPAVTDQLDGLNKKLSKQQLNYYLEMFNNILRESNQKPLDITRPYITQIARFDPSKGIIDVIEAYRALRRRMEKRGVDKKIIPQLVIAGHSAIDDPEGAPILIETMNIIHMYRYRPYADDIKIARLIHSDQLLNALLRASHIAVQLSYKEGFEVKVTEAIAKGKPVIAYNSGGIPLQINHGRNGFVVEPGDTDRVAHYLYKLFVNTSLYREMSRRCVRELNQDFFTVANATKFLQLSNDLLHK